MYFQQPPQDRPLRSINNLRNLNQQFIIWTTSQKHNIAATPKGVAINLNPINATRGRGSLRSPHPLAKIPDPPWGF